MCTNSKMLSQIDRMFAETHEAALTADIDVSAVSVGSYWLSFLTADRTARYDEPSRWPNSRHKIAAKLFFFNFHKL